MDLVAFTKLQVGAELDIATGQEVRDAMSELGQQICFPVTPRRVYQAASIAGGLAGSLLIEVGRPTTPVTWDVRHLVVLGADDHTALAGVTAAVYVGQAAQGQVSLLDCVWQGITVPGSERWNKELLVGHNERLYVLLEGTNTNTSYLVTGQVIEVQNEDLARYLG